MGAQFTIPLIEVIPGQLIASALWNNEWNNLNTNFIPAGMDSYSDTDAQMQIQTNPFPGSVTSHATSLGGEIERIRYQISQILGPTSPPYWYAAAPTNLTALASSSLPLGGIFDYHSATPPSANFLQANGQAIGRVAYAGLFALYNSLSPALPFGTGDGSTTFNLPNYNDRFSIGVNSTASTVGATGGATSQAIGTANLPSSSISVNITDPGHNHTQNSHSHSATDSGHTHVQTYQTGGGTPTTVVSRGVSGDVNGVTNNPDGANTATQSGSASISVGNTTPTNNSNTTGITAATANLGSGTALPILNPYLGMYKMIRVL